MLIFELFTKCTKIGVKKNFYDTLNNTNFTKLHKLIDFIMSFNNVKEKN